MPMLALMMGAKKTVTGGGGAITVTKMTNGVSADAGTIGLTLNGVAAGSTLIICLTYIMAGTAAAPTISGFTLAAQSGAASASGYGGRCFIYYQSNVTAGNKTVNIPLTGEDYAHASMIEVTGLATSSPVDVTQSSGPTTSNAPSTGTSAATTQADEIVIAGMLAVINGTVTITEPAGYTLIDEEQAGGTYIPSSHVYKIVSATGTQVATWTNGTSGPWACVMATFKKAP